MESNYRLIEIKDSDNIDIVSASDDGSSPVYHNTTDGKRQVCNSDGEPYFVDFNYHTIHRTDDNGDEIKETDEWIDEIDISTRWSDEDATLSYGDGLEMVSEYGIEIETSKLKNAIHNLMSYGNKFYYKEWVSPFER